MGVTQQGSSISDTQRRYEPAIDGLRAIAVLSVLLFHADFEIFQGGFVGVDVFFVISGYLITRNIMDDFERGTFSFTAFYIRRARRLLPAAFFVLLCALVIGAILLTPDHFAALGQSAIYAVFSLSNIYFWQSSGYWDAAAEVKPLLHFWSLGVEEQFYFIWPVLLVLVLKLRGRFAVFILLIILAIISLLASEYFLDKNPSTVFYLTPFRAFEFCLGALVLWRPTVKFLDEKLRSFLLLVGICLIAFSIFSYDAETRFPGLHALLPAFGTALAIAMSTKSTIISGVLTNRFSVLVGKFSYSIYLVHWPVIVYYKYWRFAELVLFEKLAIVVISLLGGALMFRYVETPFRFPIKDSGTGKHGRFLAGMACCAILITVTAMIAWQSKGWQSRYSTETLATLEIDRLKVFATYRSSICYTGAVDVLDKLDFDLCMTPDAKKENFLLIGDSYAAHLYSGLEKNFSEENILQANFSSCMPIMEHKKSDTPCATLMDYVYHEFLSDNKIEKVILSARWSRDDIEPLRDSVIYLKSLGIEPIIFGRSVEYKKHLPQIIVRRGLKFERQNMREFVRENLDIVNDELKLMAETEGVSFFDPLRAFCDEENNCEISTSSSILYQWDHGHLTPEGSDFLIREFKTAFPEF